jgi:hypothetical protein
MEAGIGCKDKDAIARNGTEMHIDCKETEVTIRI